MKKILLGFLVFLSISVCFAGQDIISLFPLDHYDQNISTWIRPDSSDIDKPLLSSEAQQKRFEDFMGHYIGDNSPWNATYINKIYRQESPNDLKSVAQGIINYFSNTDKSGNDIGYGENFRPYTNKWIHEISNNINMSRFDNLTYQSSHRAITIDNLYARALPTNDPHFYSYQLAGQGYPFDNLQMSAVWIGTPVYVITETEDHEWSYIITSDFVAWVKSNGIAMVNNAFVTTWIQTAKNKLAAITKTKTSLVDMKNKHIANAYVGSVFPANHHSNNLQLMVPAADDNHNAIIKYASISAENAAVMPVVITQRQFSKLFDTLINRPYGWGSLYFYNDCSAELKSLFTPFAIWLPRHSSNQVDSGKMVDMTASTKEERLSYLMQNGRPFLTIVYIGGHVILYIGNYQNPNKPDEKIAMTYQNIWGLSPNPPTRRAVIGQSVIFPMLLQYPEDTSLTSLAEKKFFQVSYLDQLPNTYSLRDSRAIDIKSLMYPEVMEQN